MSGAARFLYGLALGLSLGIIGSRLLSSASGGSNRPRRLPRWRGEAARPQPAAERRREAAVR